MKRYLPLLLIILLASVLRLAFISHFPAGLNADEAALGYNAYSLLLTGKDEHGNLIPINLESFGDYKPALYSYLLVPPVKAFGLTELVVRLPSALFGVLSVFLICVFAKLITGNWKLANIASLILAVSPWHLHFSRGAWEVNVATTLILLAVILFLRWTARNKLYYLVLSTLTFALSMYTYQSARILAPVLGLGLAFLFKKNLLSSLRQTVYSIFLLSAFLTPLVISLIFTDAASRVGGVGLLADEGPVNYVREIRGQHSGINSLFGRILHNRPVIYTIQFLKNYLSHFEGDFLFVNGDVIERNRVPETGLLYFTDFILLGLGFVFLSRQFMTTNNNRMTTVLFVWLFVAPIASALTFQVPHALRAQNMVVPLTLLSAGGLYYLLSIMNSPLSLPSLKLREGMGVSYKKWRLIVFSSLIIGTYAWQFSRYLHEYYVHYPQTYPAAWEYGFKALAEYITQNQSRYDRVIITNKYDQPYILLLFYTRFDPKKFQNDHELSFRDKFNFSTVNQFDKFVFANTSWDQVRDTHASLIAAASEDIPEVGVNIVNTIYFPNGDPAFKIISN